jgi:sugar/nucleoside kinase (ribokinase family)
VHNRRILVVGEVFVDLHLDLLSGHSPLARLGGIFHTARALSTYKLEFALAHISPDYLDEDINLYSCKLNSIGCYRIGIIRKATNILLVSDSKEVGFQGYYNVLKDQAEYINDMDFRQVLCRVKPTDVILFPGRYDTIRVLNELKNFDASLHIDCHYDSDNLLTEFNGNISTLFLSTSADIFRNTCNGNLEKILDFYSRNNIERIVVKESRGGSFCYDYATKDIHEAPAFHVHTMHSVGVGDVFDACFVGYLDNYDIQNRMKLASYCAAQYAATLSFECFQESVQSICGHEKEILSLQGIRLSWDDRGKKNIYIAAPDFPDVDTSLLDKLVECLEYHNFRPRLPIRENGLADKSISIEDEFKLYKKDIALLQECDLLIAVLLFNDPGTLVELGMFKQMGKPTIVFDPFGICTNMFVKHTPDYLCVSIEDVLVSSYISLQRR